MADYFFSFPMRSPNEKFSSVKDLGDTFIGLRAAITPLIVADGRLISHHLAARIHFPITILKGKPFGP